MANQFDPRVTPAGGATIGVPRVARDAGLRSYMLSVYNYMASGVALTGAVALGVANSGLINALVNPATGSPTLLYYVVLFAPLGIIFGFSFAGSRMSVATAKGLFFLYAGLLGASLSTLFLAYTGTSIATTFFATAAGFGALSLFGYTTKKDLSGFGSFLIVGVVGLLIAMVVNMFLRSPAMDMAISAIGVLLFAGLTAYDTQKIKSMYFSVAGNADAMAKTAIFGALKLYLDFINMFLFLLRFMGDRR